MKEDYYIGLLYKQLSGTIGPEEQQELESWRNESPENDETARAVELAWDQSDLLAAPVDVDLDADFAAMKAKMQRQPPGSANRSGKVVSMRKTWLAAAACIALLIIGGIYFMDSDPEIIIVETQNATEVITLDDGSVVTLNRYSTFIRPKKFGSNERSVQLEGEAFFTITKDASRPFKVETLDETITVLGTSFNVRAYGKESENRVFVASGRVAVASKSTGEEVVLNKGEQVTSGRSRLVKTTDGSGNDLAWRTKVLTFTDTPVPEVIRVLQHAYGVDITNHNPALDNCVFTADFNNQSITEVLQTIQTVFGTDEIVVQNSTCEIRGGGCD